MKITKNIFFKNFSKNKNSNDLQKKLNRIITNKNEVIKSLSLNYKYSFSKKFLKKFKGQKKILLIGMGGSILGIKAISSFLEKKIKKKNRICW